MSKQDPIPSHTTGIYVSGDELDLKAKPAYVADGVHFTVGASEFAGDYLRWLGDETVVTDNYTLALTWAYVRLSLADDGDNPMPVAKVVVHREDPLEIQPRDGEEIEDDDVVVYVTGDGVIGRDDDRYAQIAAATFEWSEISKVSSDG